MQIDTLAIIGVGLIGGSVGLAAKRRGVARRVLGVDARPAALDRCRERGAIDEGLLDLVQAACRADVIVCCTPVELLVKHVRAAAGVCSSGTLLTDAGSTKAKIVSALRDQLPEGVAFVGSHPLAGSEKHGPEHADADLFQDRLALVTPAPWTDRAAVERTTAFWHALGARVRLLDPWDHDRALALTSHLPHLVASALAGLLPPPLRELAATGFRDTTRVAAGDPSIWTGIFAQNRTAVLSALEKLEERFAAFRSVLEVGDLATLTALLEQGKNARDALAEGREQDR